MRNCLSVDVEEWLHICVDDPQLDISRWDDLPSRGGATTRDLLDLFDACQVRATFFVLGWVAERYPAIVGDIMRAGHEVASHGHLHPRVYELTPDGFRQHLDHASAALAPAVAPRLCACRAPH